jgi:hypothetical protein
VYNIKLNTYFIPTIQFKNWKNWVCNQDYKREKLSFLLSLSRSIRYLTLFTLQLNQAVFSPYLFLTTRRSKPVSEMWHQSTWKTNTSTYSGALSCTQTEPLNSLKSRHYLSEVGQQSFEWLSLPVLIIVWQIISLISFSSKPCYCYLWIDIEARELAFQ